MESFDIVNPNLIEEYDPVFRKPRFKFQVSRHLKGCKKILTDFFKDMNLMSCLDVFFSLIFRPEGFYINR